MSTTIPREASAILDAYPEAAILMGLDYQILAANDAYRKLYDEGRPLLGRHCYEVSHHNKVPCDMVGELCPLKDALCSGEPKRVLHIHHTPRGREHVDVEIRPVKNEKGEVCYFLEIMHPLRISSANAEQHGLVGRSPAYNQMLELVKRVADSETAVLLLGESGTGKELVAKAIHEESSRANKPFVPVDCSSLSESLFESALFGYEKGAFTGAASSKPGLVESAEGGTLFLDELGDIPLPHQVKLLRLLESSTYRKVGSVDEKKADFRLICATHRDIASMVESGDFRQDLFFRISPFPIELPSLRERLDDLPLLAESLLKQLSGKITRRIEPATLDALLRYRFPGNIRELRNILERAILLSDGNTIKCDALPKTLQSDPSQEVQARDPWGNEIIPLEDMEKRYLQLAAATHEGDRKSLADKLGISESALYRKLRKLTPIRVQRPNS